MKVNIENKEGLKKIASVSINKSEVQKQFDARLIELSKEASIKGFRQGKVPAKLLKEQFGKSVYGEVVEKILQETTNEVIKKNNIRLAAQPKIDIKSIEQDQDLKFNIEMDSLPDIKLQDLTKLKFTKYNVKIDEKNLLKKLDEISKNNIDYSEKKPETKSQNGDLIVFDYEALVDDQAFEGNKGSAIQLIIGKDLFIPGFDKNLIGVKKGDKKNFEINIPDNFPNEKIRNKKAVFKCEIKNIKQPSEPTIDDNLAKKLGAKDLNDLKDLVKKNISSQYESVLTQISNQEIFEEFKTKHNLELPKNMINQELEYSKNLKEKQKQEFDTKKEEENIREKLKLGLIINEYGVQNNISVNENDLKSEMYKLSQTMPGQEKFIFDYYQKNPSAISNLKASLFEKKVLEFVKSKSQSKFVEFSIDEAEKFIKDFNSKKIESTTKSSSGKSQKTDKLKKKNKK